MYSAGPPSAADGAGSRDAALGISRAERRVFDETSDAARHPDLRGFLADLVRPYGLALRDDLLAEGSGQSYGEMAEVMVRAAVPMDRPVDLIVLAFAVPDVWPERATASFLSHICPGEPMAFAVCDQGAAAAFTGLRLVREYARTDGCGRALLLMVEQAALHYYPAGPVAAVARHAAVALLCDDAGPARLETVRQHAGVAPAGAPALLAAEVARLSAGRTDVALILGPDLACLAGYGADAPPGEARPAAVDQVCVAPAGQPFTGVWWELAGGLPTWTAEGRRVLLAEYDPALQYLCLSAIDTAIGTGASPPARHRPRVAARQSPPGL